MEDERDIGCRFGNGMLENLESFPVPLLGLFCFGVASLDVVDSGPGTTTGSEPRFWAVGPGSAPRIAGTMSLDSGVYIDLNCPEDTLVLFDAGKHLTSLICICTPMPLTDFKEGAS